MVQIRRKCQVNYLSWAILNYTKVIYRSFKLFYLVPMFSNLSPPPSEGRTHMMWKSTGLTATDTYTMWTGAHESTCHVVCRVLCRTLCLLSAYHHCVTALLPSQNHPWPAHQGERGQQHLWHPGQRREVLKLWLLQTASLAPLSPPSTPSSHGR